MDQYLKQNIELHGKQPSALDPLSMQAQMPPGPLPAPLQQQPGPPEGYINFSSASKNVGPHDGKVMGQRDFFSGEEHSKFNSHWKR